jgi:Co/Zn/Cd efflux system component
MTAMSCHLVLGATADAGRLLAESSRLMREEYGIEHTTIQIEIENWIARRENATAGPRLYCSE